MVSACGACAAACCLRLAMWLLRPAEAIAAARGGKLSQQFTDGWRKDIRLTDVVDTRPGQLDGQCGGGGVRGAGVSRHRIYLVGICFRGDGVAGRRREGTNVPSCVHTSAHACVHTPVLAQSLRVSDAAACFIQSAWAVMLVGS